MNLMCVIVRNHKFLYSNWNIRAKEMFLISLITFPYFSKMYDHIRADHSGRAV
jgi:hypothetical protein